MTPGRRAWACSPGTRSTRRSNWYNPPMAERSSSSIWPVVIPAGGLLVVVLVYLTYLSIQAQFAKPEPPPPGMVRIPGGTFQMGSTDPTFRGEAEPIHAVTVGPFWIDATEVTNEQFEQFVKATGYV